MGLSKCVIKIFFRGILCGIYSKLRMYLKLILNHIFILLNLFCLIFSVIITIIISIPHYKAVPFSSLTFCLRWLMRVTLCLRLLIKLRRLQRKVICSLHYMHFSSVLPTKQIGQNLHLYQKVSTYFYMCQFLRIRSKLS